MDNIMLEKLGITLNSMQEATADAVLHTDRDVVVISPTGSGKTYAYLLPLVQRLDASSDWHFSPPMYSGIWEAGCAPCHCMADDLRWKNTVCCVM